ncbi:hypothetical protein B0T16DRAFT_413480 [Cercophora newfieldiana]|uniref:non-specific serine/threonine protein kinase n=1 Tax=Cercophora newfieldiana TaxID=92897 RepID=A0AA39Y5K5_9PEZI|nr:hypothetical protein B0T16DRAFT_413480 [Cercophora newfieldiana]
MSRATRKYGKSVKKTRAEELFAELPRSPVLKRNGPPQNIQFEHQPNAPETDEIAEKLLTITLEDETKTATQPPVQEPAQEDVAVTPPREVTPRPIQQHTPLQPPERLEPSKELRELTPTTEVPEDDLRILTWDDVCQFGDRVEKIAEASYAEVYRITNERGTSIIKVIRLQSPIKPQTKTQQKSGLVDEEPHSEADLEGELKISEWLADIPGFVVYKERYVVKGKAPKTLLETHQVFHRRMKRKDPDRLQFYPSPSRYLDDTKFLVVELGDAGTALEDFELRSAEQLWDIFLHTAIALARAEDLVRFEHRDLHEGNLCIRQVKPVNPKTDDSLRQFGYSGLEITILDYGLSRAEDPGSDTIPVAYDLEKDLSIFTSTHAPQCKVYREMRSFLLKGDRLHLPPAEHNTPYQEGVDGPITWATHYPYTNVLWLAYIYQYLVGHFKGDRKELSRFKRTTKELLSHLDPEAPRHVLSFPSACDVVRYAAEAGWITEQQLMDESSRLDDWEEGSVAYNESIIVEAKTAETDDSHLRRSPRRLTAVAA